MVHGDEPLTNEVVRQVLTAHRSRRAARDDPGRADRQHAGVRELDPPHADRHAGPESQFPRRTVRLAERADGARAGHAGSFRNWTCTSTCTPVACFRQSTTCTSSTARASCRWPLAARYLFEPSNPYPGTFAIPARERRAFRFSPPSSEADRFWTRTTSSTACAG